MTQDKIFNIICAHAREVIPALSNYEFKCDDKLKNLGANSMDRSEILMMTLESIGLRIPMIALAGANNIGELSEILHEKLS